MIRVLLPMAMRKQLDKIFISGEHLNTRNSIIFPSRMKYRVEVGISNKINSGNIEL